MDNLLLFVETPAQSPTPAVLRFLFQEQRPVFPQSCQANHYFFCRVLSVISPHARGTLSVRLLLGPTHGSWLTGNPWSAEKALLPSRGLRLAVATRSSQPRCCCTERSSVLPGYSPIDSCLLAAPLTALDPLQAGAQHETVLTNKFDASRRASGRRLKASAASKSGELYVPVGAPKVSHPPQLENSRSY